MNDKETIYAEIDDDGKLLKGTQRIKQAFKKFAGKRVIVTVERHRAKRSDAQNRLYHVYVTMLADHTGFTHDEMHSAIKAQFLKREMVIEETGLMLPFIGSTTKLTKDEFTDLIERLYQWSAETFDLVLPPPNTQVSMFDK